MGWVNGFVTLSQLMACDMLSRYAALPNPNRSARVCVESVGIATGKMEVEGWECGESEVVRWCLEGRRGDEVAEDKVGVTIDSVSQSRCRLDPLNGREPCVSSRASPKPISKR